MSKDIRKSDKFIESAMRNLPEPENSGPKTPEGKDTVRWNAVRHGININKFQLLPCKVGCYYKSICPAHDTIFNNTKLSYVGVCALEAAQYIEMRTAFEDHRYENIPEEVVVDFIQYSILKERCNRFISLNPEMIGDNNKLTLAYERHNRCQNKLLNLIKQMKEQK